MKLRVFVVLDRVRGTVYGMTTDDTERLRMLAEVVAKYPNRLPSLCASTTAGLVDA